MLESKELEVLNKISSLLIRYSMGRIDFEKLIDNKEFDSIGSEHIEIDWIEKENGLEAVGAHHGDLFKANPDTLYINWSAALQIQFHVCDMDQSWEGTREEWARHYLKAFVHSAEVRCQKMRDAYITPFLKYIK